MYARTSYIQRNNRFNVFFSETGNDSYFSPSYKVGNTIIFPKVSFSFSLFPFSSIWFLFQIEIIHFHNASGGERVNFDSRARSSVLVGEKQITAAFVSSIFMGNRKRFSPFKPLQREILYERISSSTTKHFESRTCSIWRAKRRRRGSFKCFASKFDSIEKASSAFVAVDRDKKKRRATALVHRHSSGSFSFNFIYVAITKRIEIFMDGWNGSGAWFVLQKATQSRTRHSRSQRGEREIHMLPSFRNCSFALSKCINIFHITYIIHTTFIWICESTGDEIHGSANSGRSAAILYGSILLH